ncbi:MAG: glycoside hydrolase family 2 TIM barrel-domain containing protein [Tissierellia bacterium]|nr:glycoside hydrolase family 2 TIM barrel-domain containing protein [Tissierellia bacterium]
MKKYINFNSNWLFYKGENLEFADILKLEEKDWQEINLPHDWSIYEDFNQKSLARNEGGLLDGGFGYYKKNFYIDERFYNKKILIRFGAIYMDSLIWVNGKFIGNYPFGYNEITYDISAYLSLGKNTITVKVQHKQPSSRWYSGSGIYRNVFLIVKNKLNFRQNSIVIKHENLEKNYHKDVSSKLTYIIDNDELSDIKYQLKYEIFTGEKKLVKKRTFSKELLSAKTSLAGEFNFSIKRPELWSVESPNVYYLKIYILSNQKIVDQETIRFAYRYFSWDAKEGFNLNGKYMKFHGVCLHHDNGALGASLDVDADRRKLQIMKDMGVNAIRTSHNPQSREFIEICDLLGLLVIEEIFDTWHGKPKKEFDYNRFFNKKASHPQARKNQTWASFDLEEIVRRDINSPSVFMWSIGNEIGESKEEYGLRQAENLIKWIKEIDDTRYVTIGEDKFISDSKHGYYVDIAEKLDVVGLNYCENNLENIINDHPDWKIYGSETSSALKSRGIYYNPQEKDSVATGNPNKAFRKYQMSDYGNDRVTWGKTAINSWIYDRDSKNYAGQFVWTGFDYIGEPTPWHNEEDLGAPVKSSFFGIVDTCGFPKNDYYFYQAQWLKKEERPMVKILPHWNWEDREKLKSLGSDLKRDDELVPVRVYSNLQNVDLLLNGRSLGEKSFKKKYTYYGLEYLEGNQKDELYLEWLVAFEEGKLEARAYDASYEAYDKLETCKGAFAIELKALNDPIKNRTTFIEFSVVDQDGVMDPLAENELEFFIEGAQFLGVDNGNSKSQERYQMYEDGVIRRKTFSGKGLLIVRPEQDNLKITAKSPGLKTAYLNMATQEDQIENWPEEIDL